MNNFQIFALLLSVILFVLKSGVTYLNNIEKTLSERLPVGGTVDSLMISAVFGFTISFAASTWPDLKEKLDYMQAVHLSDPLYQAFKEAANARVAINTIEDDTTRRVVETNWRQSTAAYIRNSDFIKQNRVEVPHDRVLLFANAVFGYAKESIKATSFVDKVSWWSGPEGQRYKNRNEEAIKRGISITRIFICKTNEEIHALKPILDDQYKMGINVYTMLLSKAYINEDLLILDGKIAGELKIDEDNRDFKDLYLNWNPFEVQQASTNWGDLIVAANPYKPEGLADNGTKQ